MKRRSYHTLSKLEKNIFFQYLKGLETENIPAGINMWSDDWTTKNNTLPYILEKTERFNGVNGQFTIVYDDNQIVACGGVYISSFCHSIGIAGVRTWVDEKYRHNSILRELILPVHKKWCIKNNLQAVMLTFNKYNKNIIEIFKRRRLGEKLDRISTRKKKHLFYNNFNIVPHSIIIQHTEQWAIYEQLDDTFHYDWTAIAVY